MKTIFLDSNVIIDFLADRKPFSLAAAQLFNEALLGKIKIYVSAVSYNNIYYILRQTLTHTETLILLKEFSELTEIIDTTKSIIQKALQSEFKDFEDAIQYNCALSIHGLDCIVTRDSKDFRKSILPVLTPREAIGIIKNKDA
jgi:predicted nucleic acid-binding protein